MDKNHVVNHSISQLIWCPGNQSTCTLEQKLHNY